MNNAFTLNVVSPQFPCGAAWLANAMLELQIPLHDLWGYDTAREWTQLGEGRALYSSIDMPWRQTLSSLRLGRIFNFRREIRPRFSHGFPWQIPECPKVIMVVRDPRDALYSEWRRQQQNEGLSPHISFPNFLREPFHGGPLSNIDLLWLHLRAWLHIAKNTAGSVHLLRFEDWKLDPIRSLREVCQWGNIEASTPALEEAASASDVVHLQRVEQALLYSDPKARQFNRAGLAQEWRSTWDAEWFASIGPHWQPVFADLKYPLMSVESDAHLGFSLEEVLRWRGLDSPSEIAYWMKALSF